MDDKNKQASSAAASQASATTSQASEAVSETASNAADKNAAAAKQQQKNQAIESETPDQMIKHLSKRNDDYVFRLRKALQEGGMSAAEEEKTVNELLPDILKAQHQGHPANQLYGSPLKKADDILHAPVPEKQTPYWQLVIDNTLLFFGLFTAFYGIMDLVAKNSTSQQGTGIVSTIVISIAVGFMMAYSTMWANNRGKHTRPIWQMLLMFVGVFLVLLVVIGLMSHLPASFNPNPSGMVYIVLAVITFGVRFFFKRYYHIKGTIF
ncbi:hypothetical protein IV38_GL002045 [Lactobacillus selangorensis]|uniref:Integral membrane protein n=1 Tax=Lactobacillus selangorensis TaxID=81857 RepID=A0A0R2FMK7_9LACO|nr:DUF1129 family protein [Lactobacillus selangorensis]KRN27589.1 hypothetical protein IV38_GL002045 [Lactobacillus selangorensis]KRN30138.1 hypothetical protein IV40_GL001984 [Lactobacillus selangorensis]